MAIFGFPSLDENLQPIDQFKWKMIPSSRPKLSDLYILSQSKLAAHTYIAHILQYHAPWNANESCDEQRFIILDNN